MPRSVLRIGTRGSALALAQAETVRREVSQIITKRNFELVPMTTSGDTAATEGAVANKAMFVSEIQQALLEKKIDLAVHSAKDLPAQTPEGLVLASVPSREDPRDALVTRTGAVLSQLQPGTTVGTSAARRRAQLLALGRGFDVVPVRGNVDTRLRKLSEGEVQALVVALAGLRRLGRENRVAEILPIDVMLPAPGQGALVVECRAGDRDMRAALGQIEDPAARTTFEAERSFLIAMGGDCNIPLGALAEIIDSRVRLRGLVASPDGRRLHIDQVEGDDAEKAGLLLAERMRAAGAEEIISASRSATE
jgi:hydroxymethylbilane synthase